MRFEPTKEKIVRLAIIIGLILLAMAILSKVNIVFANPVSMGIKWDADTQEIEGGQPIQNWVDYPVGAANEIAPEDDRTWLGDIYLIAVYDRMLRGDEIKVNFDAGYNGNSRVTKNLIALWNFNGNYDDQTENPLNFAYYPSGTTEWIEGGGIRINESTTLSTASPNKVVDAIKASSAFTAEVWIKPANLTQSGPARIFTISQNSGVRNFTLGQQGTEYRARCRRLGTTDQGTPALIAPAGSVELNLQHVVYAIDDRGAATIYINGVGVVSQHTLKPTSTPWEKLQVFGRDLPDGVYDYGNPIIELETTYDPNGYSKPIEEAIEVEYENFVVSKKQFIMRSCAMIDGVLECSEDSEETEQSSYEADMTRPPKTVLTMNQTGTDYVFSWSDTGERTYRYNLQYSYRDPATNRGGYVVLRTIDSPSTTVSVPIEEIQGLLTDNPKMWLTMVSITKHMIYSRWTDQDVEIQKQAPIVIPSVQNFSVKGD